MKNAACLKFKNPNVLFLTAMFITIQTLPTNAQTKEATCVWINEKINACRSFDNRYCIKDKEVVYCWYTNMIQSILQNDSSYFTLRSYFSTSGIPNESINNKSLYRGVTILSKDINKVILTEKTSDFGTCTWMEIYGKLLGTDVSEKIAFPLNLGNEYNLRERLQKAFDHLVSFNKSKETF